MTATAGWTTFDKPTAGTVYYVSSSTGNDANDGLTPETAFASLTKAFERYRAYRSYNDYVLLMRGDTFTADQSLNWDRYNGLSASQPFLIGAYGESTERPIIEIGHGVRDDSLTMGESNDLVIRNNTFYDYLPNAIVVSGGALHKNVRVENNRFFTGPQSASFDTNTCFIRGSIADVSSVTFVGNQFSSSRDRWFCLDRNFPPLTDWQQHFDPTAKAVPDRFVDPERTLTTYAHHLGYAIEQDIEQAMLSNSRLTWDPRLTGGAVAEYVKEGFVVEQP